VLVSYCCAETPRYGGAVVKSPQPLELACQSLQDIRKQLVNLARLGGGSVTPGLLQAAVDDCPDAVFVTDRQAQIVMVNGAAARLLGISTRELQKLTLWDVTHATSQADFDILWREFLRAGRQRGEYALRHQEGSVVAVAYCAEINVLPDRNVCVYRRLN
jgi:PAS domain S-box-containing protein